MQALIRWLRRAWPWLIGVAILAVVVLRMPLGAFRDAVGRGPHAQLALTNLAGVTVLLFTDSFATWLGLAAVKLRRPFADVAAVRGATYALFVLNYAVGQGAFGYYLHKTGVTGRRAIGATLFLIGTNFAALLILTTLAVFFGGADLALPSDRLPLTLEVLCAALGAYLIAIAVRPAAIARRELWAPLFDAGLGGHALAIAGRAPHVAVMVLMQWAALRVWGVPVPFGVGLAVMPILVIASVLPISPGGLGTTQAAFVYLFSSYAAGATVDDRQAAVFAFAIVHFVYGTLASLVVGFACMPFARRRGVLRTKQPI